MSSAAQLTANRANARQSTGPRTPEGKATASRNAEMHGLTSRKLTLSSEDQAAFDAQRTRLYDLHEMTTEEEHALIDRYVEARWRLDRCRRVETALFDQTIADVQSENPDLDPDLAMAALFTDDRHAKKMRLFLRYQSAIERAFYKADKALNEYLFAREKARADALAATAYGEALTAAGIPIPNALLLPPAENGFVSHQCDQSAAVMMRKTATGV